MKKGILISMFCLLSTFIFGQNPKHGYTPEERAQFQTSWMKDKLHLDETQMAQVEPLNLEYARKMEKVKTVRGRMNQLKKVKSISDEKDDKLKNILTPDQFSFYLKKRKELRDKIIEAQKESNQNILP